MTTKQADLHADDGIDEAGLLEAIVEVLDQHEWTADTTQRIVELLRQAGYTIRDVEEGRRCPECNTPLTPPEEIMEAGALPPNYCVSCDREIEV